MSGSSTHHTPEQRAQAYFEKANEATLKNNLDYAIKMYRDALQIVPGSLTYRQALRGVQRRKFGNEPSKVGRLVGARMQPIRMRAGSALSRSKFNEALELCEDAFTHNPWDVHTAQIAAEVAEGIKNPQLARWLLESVAVQAGDDAKYFRQLAHVYEINEDFERAIHCWERVRRLLPDDQDAARQIKGLSASETIFRSGLSNALSRSEKQAEADAEAQSQAEHLQSDLDDMRREVITPEQRLRKEIEAEPTRIGPYLDLVEILKRGNRLDEAEKLLAGAIKAIPAEAMLVEAHADIQLARLRRAQASWTRKVHDQPDDPSLQAKLDQVTAVLADYELKEFRRRADRHPEDANLHFQLGLKLAAAGQCDEAIGEFQKSRNAPNLKLESLYHSGLCFESKNLPKLAERNYQEALKLADPADQEMLNKLHYRLGRAAEAHGDLQAAEEHYNEVAANDYTHEDVARRLENLNRRPGS